ncbi:MAG: prepilin-type N-terminal cleavage/methylation domain-containing protein [Candidatus Omnitrophica bacterium]|nr:prepilin-type N-terminal cleavage/methylation domain-containing protein [Candidatus Omnitrophota bacterium]
MPIRGRKGYTLVEIMIVVAILAILMSVAVPNYVKSGRVASRNTCISNLRQIDGAMEQWAMNKNIPTGTVPNSIQEDEIYSYVDGGKPTCPSKGEYSLHAVSSKPQVTCSREDEGHKLPV